MIRETPCASPVAIVHRDKFAYQFCAFSLLVGIAPSLATAWVGDRLALTAFEPRSTDQQPPAFPTVATRRPPELL